MKKSSILFWCILLAAGGMLIFFQMNRSAGITKQRLPEFTLAPFDYGWTEILPGGPHHIFGREVQIEIHTRDVPDEPKILPPISFNQAALARKIVAGLPAILKKVEEAMIADNVHEPNFREFVRNAHVWLPSGEDDGETWTFVIERSDNLDFGYHSEFKGTNFVEIWGGD